MLVDKALKVLSSLTFVCRNVAAACIVILVALLFLESIVRKVVGVSIITVNEVGGIGMYLFVVSSMSWIYAIEGHIRASFFVDRLPTNARHIWNLFLHILSFVFVCLVTYLWGRMFISTFESGRYYLLTGIPEWPFHMLGVIGWGMLGLVAVGSFVTELRQAFGKITDK
jgi:TRAP-type C4-dicarboxylate transport system permease small subunit